MKTSELSGAALDWAVAKCEGKNAVFNNGVVRVMFETFGPEMNYSSDWAQGGPIIERERISLWYRGGIYAAEPFTAEWDIEGPTPLIAAMRCYVTSKLGDEVKIPESQ